MSTNVVTLNSSCDAASFLEFKLPRLEVLEPFCMDKMYFAPVNEFCISEGNRPTATVFKCDVKFTRNAAGLLN